MVLSICSQWELTKELTAGQDGREHQKNNQNPTLFKVLEMNSLSDKKAGPYFIIHMLLRDTSGDLEGGF